MKRTCSAPNQASLRDYADGKRRDAVKSLLKCQQDEFRRGQILTQKGYGIKAVEVFAAPKEREESLAGKLLEKSYDTPLFSPKELKKEFTDNDARKVFAGLFTKEPATAEKDAAVNFGVGLELTQRSHPNELKPDTSQALAEIRKELSGVPDKPISDIHKALCRPPYGLTQEMVNLYLFTLVKLGGYELALNPATQIQLTNGKPLPANKLTAHTLGLCKWNTQMDKALLGARIVASVQKGWNEVLPYARVLDDSLKPTSTPDEELQRNDQLLAVLAKLKEETPTVDPSLKALADKLEGIVPKSFAELIARLNILVATTSYQEFDAAVRESYNTPEKFKEAFAIRIDFTEHHHVGWSHYRILLSLESGLKRQFYFDQSTRQRWSVRELSRQIDRALFERVALSRDTRALVRLEKQSGPIETVRYEDAFKDPYLLDFLGLKGAYSEKDLESALIANLQQFLIELGSDFCFIRRQFPMRIDDDDYFLDLLFYHWLRSDPVETCVGWQSFDGKARTYFRSITKNEIRLAQTKPRPEDWFPSDELYENRELLTMGAGKRGIKRVSDFYFPRQLHSLAFLFSKKECLCEQGERGKPVGPSRLVG